MTIRTIARATFLTFSLTAAFGLTGCTTVRELFVGSGSGVKVQGQRIAIMPANKELEPDAELANVAVTVPAAQINASWPLPGGFADNVIPNLQVNGSLQQIWTASAGVGDEDTNPITAPPIVANGAVYTLDADGTVSAFDANTGARLWSAFIGSVDDSGGFLSSVFGSSSNSDAEHAFGGGLAYDNGKIFATTGHLSVQALDARTGAQLWKIATSVPVTAAPTIVNNQLYVVTQESQLLALNPENGQQIWDHRGISEQAAVMVSNNAAVSSDVVVVPYPSGEVVALRTDNGTELWSDALTRSANVTALTALNDIAGRPVLDRDMVFAVSHSGTMAAISLRNGQRVWTRDIAGIRTPVPVGDFVVVVGTDGKVLCLQRSSGKVKWAHQLPVFQNPDDATDPIIWSGPLLVSGRLLLTSSTGQAVLLDPQSGAQISELAIPEGALIPPVTANGTLYVLTKDATLVALR
jgi:outer membrane protein assembly factor BamB